MTPTDVDKLAQETWESLNRMSYTGGRPDLRKQDVEDIAALIRDLAAQAREAEQWEPIAAERLERWDDAKADLAACRDALSRISVFTVASVRDAFAMQKIARDAYPDQT